MAPSDPVEEFKAAVAALPNEGHRQKLMTFASSGRHFLISYPQDMTDDELLDLTAWMLNGFRAQLPPVTDGRIALARARTGLLHD